ncbi:Soul heme-binding family protein isoform 2 [Tripterygium wilfordii]|uniref:Soul heme-binding family protein isoform 2 n=1 Tax=Tripterygium wilfordii TaxID=458696 RepID=A0A7J7CTL9_TRIWF|nr:Soul heme-binding family protein isoform 2 [Tripterygium wilfordii]
MDVVSETAKYVFPKRFENRNLEDALMAVPELGTVEDKVVSRKDEYEIRAIEPCYIVETTMPGTTGFNFNGASESFNVLAEYLFGKTQSDGQKIAMTTPVITKKAGKWQMSFVMPSKYGAKLPFLKDQSVRIKEVHKKTVAVIGSLPFQLQYVDKGRLSTFKSEHQVFLWAWANMGFVHVVPARKLDGPGLSSVHETLAWER